MIYFLATYWTGVSILILIFDIYCFHALITSRFGHYAPFAPTIGNQKKFILKKIDMILSTSHVSLNVLDTGCGNGALLIELAQKFPQHHFEGIEWSLPLYKYCLFKAKTLKNIDFLHKNMFNCSFAEADIIISFLIPKMAPRFGKKAQNEISENCLVFSNGVKLEYLGLIDESSRFKGIFRQKVYVYKKKQI